MSPKTDTAEDLSIKLPYFRLFILGAGFSAPAGLPLAQQLLNGVRSRVKFTFQTGGRWDGPLEREIEEWCALYPGKPADLELVLAYSHRKHYLRLLGSDESFAHGSESIAPARRAIQEILIHETPTQAPELYKQFAQRLTPRDVVLTFNYDTLLEEALDEIGKPYSLTPEWWAKDPGPDPRYVDLLKLHGSIDWYDRHYHDETFRYYAEQGIDHVPDRDPLFGPEPSIPTEPLSRMPNEDYGEHILPRVFRVPNHREHFPINFFHAYNAVPFILPLAYDKLLGHDPILDLWENMHRTQDCYSSITLIGYSMPRYDSYAYEALGRLLIDYQAGGDTTGWEQRRVPIQVVTLSPSEHEGLQPYPFLDPRKTRIWHHGFNTGALSWLDWGDGGIEEHEA